MNVKIELTDEQIDEVVLSELKRLYKYSAEHIKKYEEDILNLKPYDFDDLIELRELIQNARFFINYFSVYDDAQRYFDSVTKELGDER
jgi:hypothetical protein